MLEAELKYFVDLCSRYGETIDSILLESQYQTFYKQFKSIEISEDARKEGDNLFRLREHDAEIHTSILEHYCRSVAFAPPASDQLLLTLSNRSAFLLHIYKYEESVNDIERALECCKPNDLLKGKLLCRKLQCLKKLGSKKYEEVLEEVERWVETRSNMQVKLNVRHLVGIVRNTPLKNELKHGKKINAEQIDKTGCSSLPVEIKFDAQHGRHLVATRKLNPGDIIFTEKSFVSTNQIMIYSRCDYCSRTCWSSLSCEYCTSVSFCSDTCKTQSWQEYHEVECAVLPDLSTLLDWSDKHHENYCLWVRMLTIGIRQAGSIQHLKTELESRDKLKDISAKTNFCDGKLGNYSLADVVILNSEYNDPHLETPESPGYSHILPFLISFIKNSPFFHESDKTCISKESLTTADAMFVGSLLVKFAKLRPQSGWNFKIGTHVSVQERAFFVYFAPIQSLISHSCYPNADTACCNRNYRERVIYALQPIEKGSKISISYTDYMFFYVNKNERQEQLKSEYCIDCDCQACSNDWPDLLNPYYLPQDELSMDRIGRAAERNIGKKLHNESMHLITYTSRLNKKYGDSQCDQRIFDKLAKTISVSLVPFEQPSMIACLLIQSLRKAFTSIHENREITRRCKRQKSKGRQIATA